MVTQAYQATRVHLATQARAGIQAYLVTRAFPGGQAIQVYLASVVSPAGLGIVARAGTLVLVAQVVTPVSVVRVGTQAFQDGRVTVGTRVSLAFPALQVGRVTQAFPAGPAIRVTQVPQV